jgi:cystathionine beta-lyase
MALHGGLDRRAFLKSAGLTAVAGAVGTDALAAVGTAAAADAGNGKFDFDTVYSRIGTDCIKWDRPIKKFGREKIAVGMGIADMDFRAAPCITKALAARCSHENWGYMDMPPSFIETIVDWNRRRYGLEIDPASVALTTGVHPGIIAALRAFAPPGSKVLLTTPTYNGFYGTDLRITRTIANDSPMKLVDGRYTIDFDDFERRIDPETHVFLLCNPQNPTGNCWTREELLRLGEICLRHRVVVLADEIHCDFVRPGHKYTPFASLPDKEIVDNSVTFKAASKSFSLSAMKTGWFFSTNPVYLKRVNAHNLGEVNTLGVVATRAALTEGEEWLDQVVAYIDGTHTLVEAFVRDRLPLVKYTRAEGTYLAWLDVSEVIERVGARRAAEEASRTSATPVTPEMIMEQWFVDHAGVHLNPGSTYGTGGAGHMRMNIATSRKLVELALNNMAEALRRV